MEQESQAEAVGREALPLAQPHSIGVRPAQLDEAAAIGELQREHLQAVFAAASAQALDQAVVSTLAQTDFAATWAAAISAPPSPAHHVLVAHEDKDIVGFLALAPAPAPQGYAEVVALIARSGDDYDRLLNAAADLARATHALGLTAWAVADDALLVRALSGAGFGPSGNRREYEVGDRRIQEHHWLAAFNEALSENSETGE